MQHKVSLLALLLWVGCASQPHGSEITPVQVPVAFDDCLLGEQPVFDPSARALDCLPQPDFEGTLAGGTLQGRWLPAEASEGLRLEVQIDGLVLGQLGPFAPQGWSGQLDLELSAEFNTELQITTAELDWFLTDLELASGNVELGEGFSLFLLTPTHLGRLEGALLLDASSVRMNRFDSTGGDVTIHADTVGTIGLREQDGEVETDFSFRVDFDPEWLHANELEAVLRFLTECNNNSCEVRLRGTFPSLPVQSDDEAIVSDADLSDCARAETHYDDCAWAFCSEHAFSPNCLPTIDDQGNLAVMPLEEPPFCEEQPEGWALDTLATPCDALAQSWATDTPCSDADEHIRDCVLTECTPETSSQLCGELAAAAQDVQYGCPTDVISQAERIPQINCAAVVADDTEAVEWVTRPRIGFLGVASSSSSDLFINGQPTGDSTPVRSLELRAGVYDVSVRFHHSDIMSEERRVLVIDGTTSNTFFRSDPVDSP